MPNLLLSHRRPRGPSICASAATNRSGRGTDTIVVGLSSTLTTAAATSSGWTGFWAALVWVPAISSVLVNVGSTTLTWTPCGANSSASAVDNPTTANFVPEYTTWPGTAVMPAIDAMLTMWPSRRSTISGSTSRQPLSTP